MAIPESYQSIANRLLVSRSWANSVTDKNRCAMVVGDALHIRPDTNQISYDEIENNPALKNHFVKAAQLAEKLSRAWGAPDYSGSGHAALTSIDTKQGVIFFEDCWRTPREKVLKWVGWSDSQTGDHIDLWNGHRLEIYPNRDQSVAFIKQAKKVLFWRTVSMDITRTA